MAAKRLWRKVGETGQDSEELPVWEGGCEPGAFLWKEGSEQERVAGHTLALIATDGDLKDCRATVQHQHM